MSVYLYLFYSNCIICKYFSDSARSVFLIMKFAVYTCNFHINLIAYSLVMRDSLGAFSDIINVYLALLCRGCNSPVNDGHKVT